MLIFQGDERFTRPQKNQRDKSESELLFRIIHGIRRPYQANRCRAGASVAIRGGLGGAKRSSTNRFAQLRHGFATSIRPTVNNPRYRPQLLHGET